MVIRDKPQRFVQGGRQSQVLLIAQLQNNPSQVVACRGVDKMPKRLTPITAPAFDGGFTWLAGVWINGDQLDARRRTDFNLHRVCRGPKHKARHGELNEQPCECREEQSKFMKETVLQEGAISCG